MNQEKELAKKIKSALANYLGLEPEDISDDDSLTADLHMKPTDLTDFAESLENINIDTSKLDFTEIDTFSDLLENLDII